MAFNPEMTLDLEKAFAAKKMKFPSFIMPWLKRFFHIDYLNAYFGQGRTGTDFCKGLLEYLDVTLDVNGLENVPADGSRYTFVSNHPLGGIDGVALGAIVGERFGENVGYLANDFIMHIKGMAPICVPVNKTGGQSRELPRLVDELFGSDRQVIVFPSGQCSRRIGGKIQDAPWTKVFVNKSIKTGRSVVPVHFIAQNSPRFYRIAGLCKRLRIKLNIAMLTLPDEMYRARHSRFRVVVGKPIPCSVFDAGRSAFDWAQWVREEVYKLD